MLEIGIIIITLIKWATFLLLAVIALFVTLTGIAIALSTKITEEEVYEVVSYPNWKTGIQIRDELRKLKGVPENAVFTDIDSVYVYLDRLENDGFIEIQEKEIPKETWHARGKRTQLEYRRTGKKREKKQPLLNALLEPTKP